MQPALYRGPGTSSDGLTQAEIREIVQDELEALPRPEPGLTMNEVEEAIRAAMAGTEALTLQDVESAIRTAVAGIPTIEPRVSAQQAETIARSVLAAAPDRYTQFFVDGAIGRNESLGRQSALDYHNSPASITARLASTVAYYNNAPNIEGRWVAFIADETGRIVGIQNPSMLGQQLEEVLGVEMFEAPSEGGWITNGGSMRIRAISQDGLTFGSGWHHGGFVN